MSLTLFGRPLPLNRPVHRALPLLPGIGVSRAQEICRRLGFPPALVVADLTATQETALATLLKTDYLVAGNLIEFQAAALARLRGNGSRRGLRLRLGLPVRGQRTRTNAQSARRNSATRARSGLGQR